MTRIWRKLKLTIALFTRCKSHYCSAHVWPAGDVSLQTPWSPWRRRRSSSSSSCQCRRSPLQTWSSPLWSPRSAEERERTRGSTEGVLMFQSDGSKVCWHPGLQTHLYIVQNLPEDGALLPPVVLGSVLIAVRGQTLQTVTQALAVLHLELLQKQGASSLKWPSRNPAVSLLRLWWLYLIDVSPQLHQQGDGLSHCDSVVDIIALQTRLQLWQVSKGWVTGWQHSTTVISSSKVNQCLQSRSNPERFCILVLFVMCVSLTGRAAQLILMEGRGWPAVPKPARRRSAGQDLQVWAWEAFPLCLGMKTWRRSPAELVTWPSPGKIAEDRHDHSSCSEPWVFQMCCCDSSLLLTSPSSAADT